MAYFKKQSSGERVTSITSPLGEESDRLVLVVEAADDPGYGGLQPLIDPAVAEIEYLNSVSGRDSVFQLTGKRIGRHTVEARNIFASRTDDDFKRSRVWASLGFVVTDVDKTANADDLIYYGRKLVWRRSLPPSAEKQGQVVFDATSGLMPIANAQTLKDTGPIPEGVYRFKAQFDPLQSTISQANAMGDMSVSNTREGLQVLPVGGNGSTQPQWGTYRVKLTPVGATKASKRDGFYLHNSYKGYTHGCIEVGDTEDKRTFFDLLVEYAKSEKAKNHPFLLLKVTYHDKFTSTKGNTKHA